MSRELELVAGRPLRPARLRCERESVVVVQAHWLPYKPDKENCVSLIRR